MTDPLPCGTHALSACEAVVYGTPAAEALAGLAEKRGAERVFVIASKTLSEGTEEIARIEAALGPRHAGTHAGIAPHAPRPDVVAAARAAREAGADLIVAVGGGSVIDCAKIVPWVIANGIEDAAGMEAIRYGAQPDAPPAPPVLRVIAAPTTLSGGEFNPLAGATEPASGAKQGYLHRLLAPAAVVLDPSLTRHTPEWLFLSTGVRSLDHAFETLQALRSNPVADGQARLALGFLLDGLKRAKADGEDLSARFACLMGVWQSMMPIVAGVPMGASHAIGHVLGGLCGVPHGHTSCVMTPAVMRWNAEEPPVAARQRAISEAFGEPETPASELADGFIRSLGQPRSLGEVGVGEDRFHAIAEHMAQDIWGQTNPRRLRSAEDVREILRLAA
ncbi:MAG: iron-containing alcohol dehydrogenase [Pseudomonadota bacterium]